ncbi:MAG TPA: hypothetical protein VM934_03665 [Pyrinomonadaceae bacterium]|jgi:hypothetical protein|nr:hypothetical protein [Pyrinomonadaceae bacterium]
MSESKKNRRQFLGMAGASLAGIAIVSTSLKLPDASAKSPVARQSDSLESWLLNTGQEELDPQLLMSVQQRVR